MVNPFVRRSSKVGLVLSLTLAIGLFVGVLPAFAQAAATASVNVRNVLAGQAGKEFRVTVTNTEPMALPGDLGGRTINTVRIIPPIARIIAVGGSASGWDDVALLGTDPTEIRFRGGSLAPGASATFTVIGDVTDQRSADSSDTWSVRVSSGTSGALAATGVGDALRTVVRQLQVQNVALVSPAGAADDRDGDGTQEVTGTQSGACVRTRVFNASASTLNVTPSVSASGVTFGPARPAGGADCSQAPLSGGSASIPGKSFADFDFLAEFGNVGAKTNRNMVGTASAPGACTPTTSGTCTPTTTAADDTFVASRIVAVEPKADLSYVGDTLRPRVVVPGSTNEAFTLSINKGPNGSPPLNPFGGTFTSAFGNTTVATPTSIGGGQQSNQAVDFAPMDIADIENDRYPVDVKFQYTDANGLIQPLTTPSGPAIENVRLDSLIPDVEISLTPPPSQVQADPPVPPALSDNEPFDANGTVTDNDPATDQQSACGPAPAAMRCTLDSVVLEQYPLSAADGGGTPVGTLEITNECTLNALGQITCSDITVNFADGVNSARAIASVTDEAGLPGEDIGDLVDVDQIVPIISGALATRGPTAGQRRSVTVNFSEPIQDSNSPLDWTVQDGQVKGTAAVTQPADKKSASITTIIDMHADVPGGTVAYSPSAIGSRYHDRVGLDLADTTVELLDGMAPLAPTFESVDGNSAQDDGKFYFNSPTVDITLTNGTASAQDPALAAGYDAEVYRESNGEDGLQRTGDALLCSNTAQGASVTLTCAIGGGEGEHDIYAVSVDPSGNVGDLSLAQLVLDLTRPVLSAATLAGDTITVTFSESLPVGSDDGQHWTFFGTRISDGERKGFSIGDMAGTGATRTMAIADGEYSAAQYTPHSIRWIFDPFEGQVRYADRAGNELLDISNAPVS